MANLEIVALLIVVSTVLILVVLHLAPGAARRRTRVLVGLVPGVLGAFVVLAERVDLVPDDIETRALPLVVLAVSGVIAVITILNLARR